MSNYTLIIAIYGALISSVALAWNIIRYFKSKKGILRIKPSLNTKFPMTNMGHTMKSFPTIDISVINLSEKPRYIKQPQFELDQKNNRYMNFLDLDNPINYPIKLNTGEEFAVYFNLDNIDEESLKEVIAKKFRVRVLDTHGKVYKSKWYNTRDFKLLK
jgi:hypothetical protein